MGRPPTRGIELVSAVLARIREAEATFLAAAVAYYAFVSLLPLFVLIVVVGTALAGEAVAGIVVDRVATVLSPSGRSLVREALTARSGRGGTGLVGTVVLAWGALKVVRGLDRAVGRVYGTNGDGSLFRTAGKAALTLGVGAAAAVVTVAAASAIRVLAGPIGLLATLGLPAVLVVTFVPLYVLLPNVAVPVRDALPGAVLAAVGWTVLGATFGIYAALAGTSLYGILGAALLLVTWLYLGALILIVGAAVNAVLAGRPHPEPR